MADREQTPEQKRYGGDVRNTGDIGDTAKKASEKIEPHRSEDKVTRSTEGSVETTTTEHKS